MNEREKLELAAHQALSGNEDALKRVMIEMSVGSPSIEDLSYAIRLRAKDDYKIVNKVLDRRNKKPDYQVSDIRDLIGLRIVTLYRLDCLDIIPKLLDIIDKPSSSNSNVFVPNSLEEVIIYSTNPVGDAQALPERLLELFNSRGYKEISCIEEKPSNYSSIHMVAWCLGKYKDEYKKIPIEIQVRTAFEDVWAEIDHKLKYKNGDKTLTIHDEKMLSTALAHLNVMKSFVDGAAQYADQIRIQKDHVDGITQEASFYRKIEDTKIKISELDIPRDLLDKIKVALNHQEEALSPERSQADLKSYRKRYLLSAIRGFDQCIEEFEERENSIKDANDLFYFLHMERALCHFQLGVELDDDTYFATALKIYSMIETKFQDRAVVAYRFAKALDAMKSRADEDAAIEKMRHTIKLLKQDKTIADGHWIHTSAPRVLGVYLWRKADRIKHDQKDLLLSKENKEKIQHLLLEAFKVSMTAHGKTKQTIPLGNGPEALQNDTSVLANNLLYYAVEFLETGGKKKKLEKFGFSEKLKQKLLKDILPEEGIDQLSDVNTLDTLARYYIHEQDIAAAKKAAKKLETALAEQGITKADVATGSDEYYMLELVKDILGLAS